MTKLLILVLAVAIVLVGCDPIVSVSNSDQCQEAFGTAGPGGTTAQRCYDAEAQVVCYIYGYTSGAAIDCLPLDETALDR